MSLVLRGFLSIEVVSDAIAVRSWDATFDGAQPAGYATTATRTRSRHTDEVIVMMLDWNDYQPSLEPQGFGGKIVIIDCHDL